MQYLTDRRRHIHAGEAARRRSPHGTVEGIDPTRLIIPLIMCGGAGTRLWPASRENRPKQFLPLFGPSSTFQETLRRVCDPGLFGRPIVVTNAQYRFLVAEQLAAIPIEADILPGAEPGEIRPGHCSWRQLCC